MLRLVIFSFLLLTALYSVSSFIPLRLSRKNELKLENILLYFSPSFFIIFAWIRGFIRPIIKNDKKAKRATHQFIKNPIVRIKTREVVIAINIGLIV